MWYYNGEPFTSDMIEDYVGFVYEITDTRNGMKYIGKKGLMSKRKLPLSREQSERERRLLKLTGKIIMARMKLSRH